MYKDREPIYGEELPLRPPLRWHDAVRSLPGDFLDEGVFETQTNIFDTPDTERPFLYFLLSIDGEDKFQALEPGIYLGATIAPGIFERHGGKTFSGLENDIIFLFLSDNKSSITMPLAELNETIDEDQILELPKDVQVDLSGTIEIKPHLSYDISNQGEIPFDFMTFYKISPASLQHITTTLSNSDNQKSIDLF